MKRVSPGTSPGWKHALEGEQLKMFMTPREIHAKYQPLDADREETTSDRYWEPTNSPVSTMGNTNIKIPEAVHQAGSASEWPQAWEWARRRHGDDLKNFSHMHGEDYHTESDSELWSRKLDESQLAPPEYSEMHGGGRTQEAGPPGFGTMVEQASRKPPEAPGRVDRKLTTQEWEDHDDAVASYDDYIARKMDSAAGKFNEKYGWDAPSLYDFTASHGVEKPVHLGTDARLGSEGKPQIFGGHHRIAAMTHINQDQLIPVLHHEDFQEARWDQNPDSPFKYT